MEEIKLQGIYAKQKAVRAKELMVGDVTIWNYGYREKVIEKEFSKTKKTVTLKIKSLESGSIFTRKLRATRLVGIDLNFNKMCLNCRKLRNTCSGERNKSYTGCVFKRTKDDLRN